MRDDGARGGHGYFGASRGHGTRPHTGIDIRGDLNITPVVAFLAGTVSAIGNQPRGYGNIVTIDHGNGLTSRYSHLQNGSISAAGIVVGQQVGQGQPVGTVGNTGNARNTTPHLHFEIRQNNVPTNPATFLNQPCPP
jgi:murein DD-endopeptidase MepM/ murein hydrolase activator NlpD